ncbi:MAG: hypothetical protein ACT4O9_15055, partial [Blastocatellia bacterium]
MKRLLLGFLVFVVTFLIGYFVVPDFQTTIEDQTPSQMVERVTQLNANFAPVVPLPRDEDFVPEFRDLPNFDDLEFDQPIGEVIDILEDGIYRQSEVVARNGESWLVLVKQYGNYSLINSKASVKKLKSISWPGEEHDAKLSFSGKGKPFIAFRKIRGLKQGLVITVFHKPLWGENSDGKPEFEELADGYNHRFELDSKIYTLRTSKGMTHDGTKVAVLVLDFGGKSQVIKKTHHVPTDDRDIMGSLLWSGDLD